MILITVSNWEKILSTSIDVVKIQEKGTVEDKMVGWHHQLNGHAFEQAPGADEGQGSLVCCSPCGCKESDMTEQLNSNNKWFHLCKILANAEEII